ncbi:MAG: DMT family transporter [Candidatus Marinimicrobia bacterium]|jgi:drug/metabolite transporter (DMT)-like permease|nr:DMT family transporter [Candidatus Neomarinimicrobiota bacterium]MBT3501465.1 DMT family transporter [Candidatus Neomarinimicrobiota bacterium]MBT3839396.1 DMT family transporter [Candidatus Neomarinimicrobiota bacterium]MBT3998889.1 DMT family transporter [Candidatus Neomarinimicrobiota bacterium]MBT4283091.1 DMT family transporter [Candidatus Neomarinimicrobiota bacterium]
MKDKLNSKKFLLTIQMVLAMATWGLSWTNAKILGDYGSPSLMMFWRFFFAMLSFAPVVFFSKHSFKVSKDSYLKVILGALCITSYNFFYFKGTQLGFAGIGGVLVPTFNPIFTTIVSAGFFSSFLYRKDIVGLLFGILGGLILIRTWELNLEMFFQSGNMYFILASFSWAGLTNVIAHGKGSISFITFTFWCYFCSIFFSFFLTNGIDLFSIFSFDWIFWLNMMILSTVAMAFGTSTYFKATTVMGPKKASSYIFMVPITAVIFALIFLGEPIHFSTIIGGAFAGVAVYLINK